MTEMRMFTCRGCGCDLQRRVFQETHDRFRGGPGRFDYVECLECGLVQLEEMPEAIGSYYDQYPVHAEDSRLYQLVRRLTIGHCYFQEAGRDRAMLDFGCGNGWYLQEMRRRGWRTTGFEFDPGYAQAVEKRTGIAVHSHDEDLAPYFGELDLVTFNFSFEHLPNPRHYLDLARSCLKVGGQIFISVPNIGGREARLFGDRWFHLDPPRHITLFTKNQLTEALRASGFRTVEVKDLPVPTGFAGSVSYHLFDRFSKASWYLGILPGMLFCQVVRDGNFSVRATRT